MVVAMMMALVVKALMRLGEVGGSHKKGEDDQRRGATQDLHQGPQFISEKEIRAHLTFSSHSKPAHFANYRVTILSENYAVTCHKKWRGLS